MKLAGCLVLALVGCTVPPTAPTDTRPPASSVYTLATVAGRPIPYTRPDGVTYVVGRLTLRQDSTFTDTRIIRYDGTTLDISGSGRYEPRGDSIRFTNTNGTAFVMGVGAGTLSAVWSDGLFIYRQ